MKRRGGRRFPAGESPGSGFLRRALAGAFVLLASVSGTGANDRPIEKRGLPQPLAAEMIEAHNTVRAEMHLPLLEWSGDLAAYAQEWADAAARDWGDTTIQEWAEIFMRWNHSVHNPATPYGENIFLCGAGARPVLVVTEWAAESRHYDYRTNSCESNCGHYTQLVWRDTRRVGCGVARNSEWEIWVCSYDPPGNYRGKRPY